MNQRNAIIAGFSAILVAGLVFQYSQKKEISTAPAIANVRIGQSMSPMNAPFHVAEKMAFWKDAGINIEMKDFQSARPAMEALLGGQVDFVTVADTTFIVAALRGQKIVVLGRYALSTGHIRMVVRTDRGIDKASDLKGKKIGLAMATTQETFLDHVLSKNDLTANDVTKVNLQPADVGPALVNGAIDAAVDWEPHLSRMMEFPKAKLLKPEDLVSDATPYRLTLSIACMPAFAEKNLALVRKVLTVLKRATDYATQNPQETIAITSARLKMKPDVSTAMWDRYNFDLRLDQELVDVLNEQQNWARSRVAKDVPALDVRTLLAPDFLRSSAPQQVRLP